MGFSRLSFDWDEFGGRATLTRGLIYTEPSGAIHTIPEGFTSDGATIHRFFWRIIGPPIGGPYTSPAFLHDWYYYLGTLGKDGADRLFLAAMSDEARVGWLKRSVIYLAVKYFGHRSYEKHRRKQLEESKQGIKTLRTASRAVAPLPGSGPDHGNRCECEICSGPD